jgi:hypothetical protein
MPAGHLSMAPEPPIAQRPVALCVLDGFITPNLVDREQESKTNFDIKFWRSNGSLLRLRTRYGLAHG